MKFSLTKWKDGDEAAAWKDAIFVFDTSTLLNFILLFHANRENIYNDIFSKLKGRLWITNHAEYEYLKNFSKVLNQPRSSYKSIQYSILSAGSVKGMEETYRKKKEELVNANKHPFFDDTAFAKMDQAFDAFIKAHQEFEKHIGEQINVQVDEHFEKMKEDNLLKFFEVSEGSSFKEIVEIVKEGEIRYRHKIPPGYMDDNDKEKGFEKYGDLIVWKQMIALAEKEKRTILFVTDDEKEDWWILNSKDKSVSAPRHELIKEMKDEAGVFYWSYTFGQFLSKAKDLLDVEVADETIENVTSVTSALRPVYVSVIVDNWIREKFKPQVIYFAKDINPRAHSDINFTIDGKFVSVFINIIDRPGITANALGKSWDGIVSTRIEHPESQIVEVIVCNDYNAALTALRGIKDITGVCDRYYAGFINKEGVFVDVNVNEELESFMFASIL